MEFSFIIIVGHISTDENTRGTTPIVPIDRRIQP
jgi:hypothetical protein